MICDIEMVFGGRELEMGVLGWVLFCVLGNGFVKDFTFWKF